MNIIKNKQLANTLIYTFPTSDYNRKASIIKYILKFHDNDVDIIKSLSKKITQHNKNSISGSVNVRDLINYMREISKYNKIINDDDQVYKEYMEQAFDVIKEKIMLVDPKMLYVLSLVMQSSLKPQLPNDKNIDMK